jgi:hypothetical protein
MIIPFEKYLYWFQWTNVIDSNVECINIAKNMLHYDSGKTSITFFHYHSSSFSSLLTSVICSLFVYCKSSCSLNTDVQIGKILFVVLMEKFSSIFFSLSFSLFTEDWCYFLYYYLFDLIHFELRNVKISNHLFNHKFTSYDNIKLYSQNLNHRRNDKVPNDQYVIVFFRLTFINVTLIILSKGFFTWLKCDKNYN